MKIAFVVLLIVHSLIHLMGFFKEFNSGHILQLTQSFSNSIGLLWLLAVISFMIVLALYLLKNPLWFWFAFVAVLLSQLLIFYSWEDAKYGTIANCFILVITIIAMASWNFESKYRIDVSESIEAASPSEEIVLEKDIERLPIPIQKYLRYVGVIGKPKVTNAKISLKGQMREKGKDWFNFTSEQFNFFENPTRLFFMKANFKGFPTRGYHRYKHGKASMNVKLLSLISVVKIENSQIYKAETVTYFSELCLLAPAALIDQDIQWEVIDDSSVRAKFNIKEISISAILYFNEKDQLINFVSYDRVDVNSNMAIPFSTPISKYGQINGYNLPVSAHLVWNYPSGDFEYGKFNVELVEYNVIR